jgi:hypothetical protein
MGIQRSTAPLPGCFDLDLVALGPVQAQLAAGSREHCRPFPRIDFFRFTDLAVDRRTATCRHAATRTKLVARSRPRHIRSSLACRGCKSTLCGPLCYSAVTADEQLLLPGEQLQTPSFDASTQRHARLFSCTDRWPELT